MQNITTKRNKLIAVIDDEPDIVELVSIHLRKANFEVTGFFDANSFYKLPPTLSVVLQNQYSIERQCHSFSSFQNHLWSSFTCLFA